MLQNIHQLLFLKITKTESLKKFHFFSTNRNYTQSCNYRCFHGDTGDPGICRGGQRKTWVGRTKGPECFGPRGASDFAPKLGTGTVVGAGNHGG